MLKSILQHRQARREFNRIKRFLCTRAFFRLQISLGTHHNMRRVRV